VSDKPAETLLQRNRRLRHLVIKERVPTLFPNVANARFHDRVAGDGEGQAVDDHAAQLFTGYVDTLPEGAGCTEHTVGRAAEFVEQRIARPCALQEGRILKLQRYPVINEPHLLNAGKEHESSSAAQTENPDYFFGGQLGERRIARIGEVLGHI